ncbi:nitroreductase family protein [Halioglobus maricola]|uniref:Nitroreductase family protein n=1 Tax=Halioglobus maricola TaxID=2601894 RepID=A0A5P9NH81_9GAMM|nr:nitroreductase family protein [Halioglobus maricola]QFU75142.1 nitroreductase family protein [Halioglobus maricola]
MTKLNLTADEVLSTTRAVRKRLNFDRPVEDTLLRECLEIALQAPSGSNSQGWQFMLVTDREKISAIAEYYRQAFATYEASEAQPMKQHLDDPGMATTQARVLNSAQFLAANLHRAPAVLIPCMQGRPDTPGLPAGIIAGMYGSIIPATWSFMLAARERGLGTCWTTLHLNYEQEVAQLLSIPEGYTQVALIPIAYTQGTQFSPAPRKSLEDCLHLNSWQTSSAE